jgi:hypothetical protein
MSLINLSAVPQDLKFTVARALAIEGYANVEQALSSFFSFLLGTKPDSGAIVFFRITNTHSRNRIIKDLIAKVHGDSYKAYWHGAKHVPGMFSLINQLDDQRNQIVHWHVIASIDLENKSQTSKLAPPNFWSYGPHSTNITIYQLIDFAMKSDFVFKSINMFHWITGRKHPISDADRAPWLRIFETPPTYPPPNTHPLSPNYTPGN